MPDNDIADQQALELTQELAPMIDKAQKAERTMKMTFSISPTDRILIKTFAIRNNLTVSDLIHQWIVENCTE